MSNVANQSWLNDLLAGPAGPPGPPGATGPAGASYQLAEPMDLDPHLIAIDVPFSTAGVGIQPPACLWVNDPMTDTTTSRFTLNLDSTVSVGVSGGNLNETNTAVANAWISEGQNLSCLAACVSAEYTAASYTGSTPSFEDYSLGFGDGGVLGNSGYAAFAVWSKTSGACCFQVFNGSNNDNLSSVSVSWTVPFFFACSLVGNSICAWYKKLSTDPWQLITSYDMTSLFDVRIHGSYVTSSWKGMIHTATSPNSGSTSFSLTDFKIGLFGTVGMRDISPVTDLNGNTLASGDVVYLTASCFDPQISLTGNGSGQHMGMFTYDLVQDVLTMTGSLWNNRVTPSSGGNSLSLTLSGTFGVTNGSPTVSTSSNLVGGAGLVAAVYPGAVVQFAAQAGVPYVVASLTSSALTLTTNYTGTTNGSTTSQLGSVQPDDAGQVIDNLDGTYHALFSTWGNQGTTTQNIVVSHAKTSAFLYLGGNVVHGTPFVLTNPTNCGCYDPSMVFDSTAGLWYLAVTTGTTSGSGNPANVRPFLSSSPDLVTWTEVGADLNYNAEGSRTVYLNGSHWFLWSSYPPGSYVYPPAIGTNDCNVYDEAFRFRGKFRIPVFASDSYPPHPALVPHGNYVYLLTFDGTQFNSTANTNGNLMVYRARN